MDQTPGAGPSVRRVDGEEVDVDWLQLKKVNHDVNVRVSDKVNLAGLPDRANLLVVSNHYGLLVVGSSSDVRIHRLSDSQQALESAAKDAAPTLSPLCTIQLSARPIWIRLAMDDERLLVAVDGGVGILSFRLSEVLRGNMSPYHTFGPISDQIVELLPNPASMSAPNSPARLVAILSASSLVFADLETNSLSAPISGAFASMSWSSKGKQVVVGTSDGKLVQYTPDGTAKAEIPPPQFDSPGTYLVTSVEWLETDLFLVSYAAQNSGKNEPCQVFIISRSRDHITHTKFYDPLDTMGVTGRSGAYRHVAALRDWGSETKHLAFLMSGLATEVAVMRGSAPFADGEAPAWQVLILEETARGTMPAAKAGERDDSSCLGIALDLTSSKPIRRGVVGGVELPDLSPAPRVLVYTQEGFIVCFEVRYGDGGQYAGMITPKQLAPLSADTPTPQPAPVASVPVAAPTGSAFDSSGFAQPAASIKGGFSSSAFGTPSKPTPSATMSAFGSSATPPTSGSPAFGQSAFGQASASTPGPSAFGQSAFGQATKPAAPVTAFGASAPSAQQSSAFGQSAFGTPSKPVGFGQSAFGQSSTPAASIAPSAFDSSASGSTGGFAGFGKAKPAGPTGFGFGASAFGQSSQPAAASPEASKSAFAPNSSSSGFGIASRSASAFGQPAFGAKSSSTDGKTGFAGFGQQAADQKPAFGGFGQQAQPGQSSGFAGFGGASTPQAAAPTTATPKSAEIEDFGMDGFSSALDSSTPAAVPGLADSPPASPVFGATKAMISMADSPPTSPILSAAALPKPVASASTTASSSFIKPATAFAGAASSGFGAFGQSSTNKSQSAFGTSSAPNAFSATANPSTSTPASASPAFGQSSSITPAGPSAAKPAFGRSSAIGSNKPATSAFGQPSTPSAFSAPSLSSGSAFSGFSAGSSSGFGAFATAAKTDDKKAPAFAGFGNAAKSAPPASTSSGFAGFGQQNNPQTMATATDTPKSSGFAGFGQKTSGGSAFSQFQSAPSFSGSGTASTSKGVETKSIPKQAAETPATDSTPAHVEPTTPAIEKKDENSDVVAAPEDEVAVGYDVPTPAKVDAKAAPPEQESEPTNDPHSRVGSSPEIIDPNEEDEYDEEDDSRVEDDYEDDEEGEGDDEDAEDWEEEGDSADEDEDDSLDRSEAEEEVERKAEDEDEEELHHEVEEQAASGPSAVPLKSPPAWFTTDASPTAAQPQASDPPSILSRLDPSPEPEAKNTPPAPSLLSPTSVPPSTPQSDSSDEPTLLSRTSPSPEPGSQSQEPLASTNPDEAAGFPPATDDKSDSSSLLSRPPSLLNKHAARTSSPLAYQPPQMPSESATPAASPAKPTSGFNFFSNNESAGFAAIATTNGTNFAPKTQSPAPVAAAKIDPPMSGGPLTSSARDLQATGAPEPVAPLSGKPTEAIKPAFGLGIGKPSVGGSNPAARTASPTTAALTQAPPAFGGFSGFGAPSKPVPMISSPPSKPATATPPAPVTPAKPPVPSTFEPPSRSPAPSTPARKAPKDKTMSAVMESMFTELAADVQALKTALANSASFHANVKVEGFAKITLGTLDKHKTVPFSSIRDLEAVIGVLEKQVFNTRGNDAMSHVQLADLQATMVKTAMKAGQADKLFKARRDPAFATALHGHELGAEQAAQQARLSAAVTTAERRLAELEERISNIKKKRNRISTILGGGSKAPGMDYIQREVRNVDAVIREKQRTVDELSRRLGTIRLSTPARGSRQGSPALQTKHDTGSSIAGSPGPAANFSVPAEVEKAVLHDLDRETKRRERLRDLRSAPLRQVKASTDRTVVSLDSLPPPGKFDKALLREEFEEPRPTIKEEIKDEPAVPATSSGGASQPSFGGLSLSLNPGTVASSSRSRVSTHGRNHAPAARLSSGAPGSTDDGSGPTMPGGFGGLFDSKPMQAGAGGSSGPKEFFSFSGFGGAK